MSSHLWLARLIYSHGIYRKYDSPCVCASTHLCVVQCKEYLLLKRADSETHAQLDDLCMRYSTKVRHVIHIWYESPKVMPELSWLHGLLRMPPLQLSAPQNRALQTTNEVKDNFNGKLRDPDMADWANHRKKSAITEYVRSAIRLHVNLKASGH